MELSRDELYSKIEALTISQSRQSLTEQLSDLQAQLTAPGVWDDPQAAGKIHQNFTRIQRRTEQFERLESEWENLKIAVDLADEKEILSLQNTCFELVTEIENQEFLNGRFDNHGALITIQSGAGGVDAQDWAAMLTAMYQSCAQNQSWSHTVIELSAGEEGGVKSATLKIEGSFAYGLLQEEAGVHRLVRVSPFNSGGTRETSFARIEVVPTGLADTVELADIPQEDLRWDYFMSSGKGGQGVNTTYSAVRLVHLPTGITISCQNERSQQQNKQQALTYLRDKLTVLELQKQKDFQNELRGNIGSAEWGNQIRNYVLHPYKLIKDARSGWETADVDAVLQRGDILDIIWSVKRWRVSQSS